jgi:hypothetical protein
MHSSPEHRPPKICHLTWKTAEPNETLLPARMRALQIQLQRPDHITDYVNEFQIALRMINAWYKTHPTSETMSNQIKSWIQTCDLLTESQHFNEQKNWKVPTFQPWYHYDAYLCLQQYFHIQHRIADPKNHTEVDKQQQSAQNMFDTWEEVCFRVFQRNLTPIPKCLWYYKAKYVQRNETEKWKHFFHDTPFQTWGYADGKNERTERHIRTPPRGPVHSSWKTR